MQSIANATWAVRANPANSRLRRSGLVQIILSAIVGAAVAVATMQVAKREDDSDAHAERIAALESRVVSLIGYNQEIAKLHGKYFGKLNAEVRYLMFKDGCADLNLYELAEIQASEAKTVQLLLAYSTLDEDFFKKVDSDVTSTNKRLQRVIARLRKNVEDMKDSLPKEDESNSSSPAPQVVQ